MRLASDPGSSPWSSAATGSLKPAPCCHSAARSVAFDRRSSWRDHRAARHGRPLARSCARFHLLTATGDGERILPTAITERLCVGADGQLEPVTPGSTRPVALTVTHAGICRVRQYAFGMP